MIRKINILAIIPARYNSTRLPGKVMASIGGQPMIQRVYEQVAKYSGFNRIIVATDDRRIFEVIVKSGGEAIMTATTHRSGTERIAEVADQLENYDVIVNIQGDQPFIDERFFKALLQPYYQEDFPEMATLACPLSVVDYANTNVVKVSIGDDHYARNFFRSYDGTNAMQDNVWQHVGVYAFQPAFLSQLVKMPESKRERSEHLEQQRAMENRHQIYVTIVDAPLLAVDDPDSLKQANQIANDRSS